MDVCQYNCKMESLPTFLGSPVFDPSVTGGAGNGRNRPYGCNLLHPYDPFGVQSGTVTDPKDGGLSGARLKMRAPKTYFPQVPIGQVPPQHAICEDSIPAWIRESVPATGGGIRTQSRQRPHYLAVAVGFLL